MQSNCCDAPESLSAADADSFSFSSQMNAGPEFLPERTFECLGACLLMSHTLSCVRPKIGIKRSHTYLNISLSWRSVEGPGPEEESRCKLTEARGVQVEKTMKDFLEG